MIVPLGAFVVVRPDTPDAVTAGGIVIPERARQAVQRGVVERVGPGHRPPRHAHRLPMFTKPGDVVLFAREGGQEFREDGVEKLLIRENNLLAIERADGLEPLLDRALLRRRTWISRSPIVTPDAHRKQGLLCDVVRTGPGRLFDNGRICPMDVKPGDVVAIHEYATEIDIHGESLLIVGEAEILAAFEDVAAHATVEAA